MIDGDEHYWIGRKPKTYCSTRGEVTVERNVYRPRGVHNGAQACPLELQVGMVGGKWTPNCANDMAFLAARVPLARSGRNRRANWLVELLRAEFSARDEMARRTLGG